MRPIAPQEKAKARVARRVRARAKVEKETKVLVKERLLVQNEDAGIAEEITTLTHVRRWIKVSK